MPDPQPPEGGLAHEHASPAMTLSEDELVIKTELVKTGSARLVKRVEVETVTRTIQLRREVLQVERLDPETASEVDEPGAPDVEQRGAVPAVLQSGLLAPGSLQEGAVEIVLMQEEAVIATQMVPRERVRLTKQIVTENRMIDADLQAEHVDLEQNADKSGRP